MAMTCRSSCHITRIAPDAATSGRGHLARGLSPHDVVHHASRQRVRLAYRMGWIVTGVRLTIQLRTPGFNA